MSPSPGGFRQIGAPIKSPSFLYLEVVETYPQSLQAAHRWSAQRQMLCRSWREHCLVQYLPRCSHLTVYKKLRWSHWPLCTDPSRCSTCNAWRTRLVTRLATYFISFLLSLWIATTLKKWLFKCSRTIAGGSWGSTMSSNKGRKDRLQPWKFLRPSRSFPRRKRRKLLVITVCLVWDISQLPSLVVSPGYHRRTLPRQPDAVLDMI